MLKVREKQTVKLRGQVYLPTALYSEVHKVLKTACFDIVTVVGDMPLRIELPNAVIERENNMATHSNPSALSMLLTVNAKAMSLRYNQVYEGVLNKKVNASRAEMKERYTYLNIFLKKEALPYRIKLSRGHSVVLYHIEEEVEKPIMLHEIKDSYVENLFSLVLRLMPYNWTHLVCMIEGAATSEYKLASDFLTTYYKVPIVYESM